MPYEVSYENGGFVMVYQGRVTISEINESNGRVQGHEDFDGHSYQIVDLLDADFSGLTIDDARLPAATDTVASRFHGEVKVAMVVGDEHARVFCEEYVKTVETLGGRWEFGIFESIEAARQWIGGASGSELAGR